MCLTSSLLLTAVITYFDNYYKLHIVYLLSGDLQLVSHPSPIYVCICYVQSANVVLLMYPLHPGLELQHTKSVISNRKTIVMLKFESTKRYIIVLETLIIVQIVKTFSAFYESQGS
jgi:hypothetical protein